MLTQTEKYNVLRYLGYPIRTIDSTSLSYIKQVADRLSTFPTDAEGILRELLDRISTLDGQLEKQVAKSNVKSIDDIEFFDHGADELRRERRKVINEIAVLVDIRPGPGFAAGGCIPVVL